MSPSAPLLRVENLYAEVERKEIHRMLEFVRPDRVHVLMGGRLVRSGGPDLASEIDRRGYEWIAPGSETAA